MRERGREKDLIIYKYIYIELYVFIYNFKDKFMPLQINLTTSSIFICFLLLQFLLL